MFVFSSDPVFQNTGPILAWGLGRSVDGPNVLMEGVKVFFCFLFVCNLVLIRYFYLAIHIYIYKYSTASEQPGFLLFSVQTETIFLKFSGKSRKLKRATAGNRNVYIYIYIYN